MRVLRLMLDFAPRQRRCPMWVVQINLFSATMRPRHAAALALVGFLLPGNSFAKCGASAIRIEGVISGPAARSTVSAQVVPAPDWNSEPATIDADGHFHATIYFDRLETGTWRAWLTELIPFRDPESCSREPRTVAVQLYTNGQLVDQLAPQIERDFVRNDDADFSVRSPITLHSR